MSSVRRLQRSALWCLGGLSGFAVLVPLAALAATACGSSDGNGDTSPTGTANPDGGSPSGDAAASVDGGSDAGPSVEGPFTFRDRLAGWSGGYTGGWYRAHGYAISGKRLFSVPDALSSTLVAVTVVDVSVPAKPRVFSLPVSGTFPSGSVECFVYDPAGDRMVMLVRPYGAPLKPVVVTIAVGDKQATFTTFTQAGTPLDAKTLLGPLYATGAPGVLVAGLGNSAASFTLSGTTATWSAPSEGTLFAGNDATAAEDPAHGRVFSFGKLVYDAAAMTSHTEPNIETLSLTAAPYQWTALPFSGDAPPNTPSLPTYGFTVYDSTGNRILASSRHDGTCGNVACTTQGLWSFDLGTMAWTKLQDQWFGPNAYGGAPFLVDQAARRTLAPSDGALRATSLDTTANPTLTDSALTQDGDLGPSSPTAATVLADGRILSTDGVALRVLDPKAAAPRWERFGTVAMPASIGTSGTLSVDPKTGEILAFGQADAQGKLSMELHVISADGKTIAPVTFDAGPPPRAAQGALVVDGTLYIAGGYGASTGPTATALGDVWAFDRASSKWTQLGTLPGVIANGALGLGPKGELLIMGLVPLPSGGSTSYANSKVFAIDRASHVITSMNSAPTTWNLWSLAPYRGCFVGYESDSAVDNSGPTLWRCTIASGTITWTPTKLQEHDFVVNGLRAAGTSDGLHAYFVGRHLWEAIGK